MDLGEPEKEELLAMGKEEIRECVCSGGGAGLGTRKDNGYSDSHISFGD